MGTEETEFEQAGMPKGFLITLARLFLTSLLQMVCDAILHPPIYSALIEKAELHCGPTVRSASNMFLLFVGALEGSVHDYPDVLVWLCETFLLIHVAIKAYNNNSAILQTSVPSTD
ncbi:hypothetical protein DFH08DRAFT_816676 [Mycena albidolilacea]|uniref:Uncharacterized protein n=1 Tax=Mycena albidolilacea TaxID=1033008 RepID=A0AAD7EJ65_9AGAR|nr:hypothetical protein DFH08DRAFT_816676 [Mycena albidolilacea]